LDQCIRELEEHGYVRPEPPETRYRKVRPGVWRVGFTLEDRHRRSGRGGGMTAPDRKSQQPESPARDLVRSFHALWSGGGDCNPGTKEIAIAERLIETHGQETVASLLPRVVAVLKDKWPDCKTFRGVEAYLDEAMRPVHEQRRREEDREREQELADADRRRCEERRQRQAELERAWQSLPADEQEAIRSEALRGHPADVLARRPSLAHTLCLAELRRRVGESEEPVVSA
jgi:hypothetical protein